MIATMKTDATGYTPNVLCCSRYPGGNGALCVVGGEAMVGIGKEQYNEKN